MSALDEMLEAILSAAAGSAFAVQAFRRTAADLGLGDSGAQLIALGHKIRFFAADCLRSEGDIPPTLWLIDSDVRQWAFGADFTSTEDDHDDPLNWGSMRLLLKKLDTTAYCLVQKTISVKVKRDMTVLERRALRERPDADKVAVVYGESIDGGAILLSYRISEAGQIDIDKPMTSVVGRKDRWPGPPGAEFADHGFAELLPRPKEPEQ